MYDLVLGTLIDSDRGAHHKLRCTGVEWRDQVSPLGSGAQDKMATPLYDQEQAAASSYDIGMTINHTTNLFTRALACNNL